MLLFFLFFSCLFCKVYSKTNKYCELATSQRPVSSRQWVIWPCVWFPQARSIKREEWVKKKNYQLFLIELNFLKSSTVYIRACFCFRPSKSHKGSPWCSGHKGAQGQWGHTSVITSYCRLLTLRPHPSSSLCAWPASSTATLPRKSSGWGTIGRSSTRASSPSPKSPSAAASPLMTSPWRTPASTASSCATSTAQKQSTWRSVSTRAVRSLRPTQWRWANVRGSSCFRCLLSNIESSKVQKNQTGVG